MRELLFMSWVFLSAQVSKRTGKPVCPAAWNNTRGDGVASIGLWNNSFQERGCLVPAISFRKDKERNPETEYWFASPFALPSSPDTEGRLTDASMNADEIEEATPALPDQPFNVEKFPYGLLLTLRNKDTAIKRLHSGASNKFDLNGEFQTNQIHFKTCAEGVAG